MFSRLIEFAVVLGLIFLFHRCCVKCALTRASHPASDAPAEDLRRFRVRLSERRSERRGDDATAATPDENSREELVALNLFSRKIKREESVKEIAQLLAVSRGGAVDVELGEAGPELIQPDYESTESSRPEPSAPDPSDSSASSRLAATDTIATAIVTPPDLPPSTVEPPKNSIALEPLRQLWSSLTNNVPGSERPDDDTAPVAADGCPLPAPRKCECSICLDPYVPGDTVAWARDGGDPPEAASSLASGSANCREAGCDHLFHRECLTAWLLEHDDCPLCRRRVVHANAAVRFAGWGMG